MVKHQLIRDDQQELEHLEAERHVADLQTEQDIDEYDGYLEILAATRDEEEEERIRESKWRDYIKGKYWWESYEEANKQK